MSIKGLSLSFSDHLLRYLHLQSKEGALLVKRFSLSNGDTMPLLTDAISYLSTHKDKRVSKCLQARCSQLPTSSLHELFAKIAQKSTTRSHFNACLALVPSTQVEKVVKDSQGAAQTLQEMVQLTADIYDRPPTTTKMIKNSFEKQWVEGSSYLETTLHNFLSALSLSYDLSLEEPPQERFEAQMQVSFYRQMLSDLLSGFEFITKNIALSAVKSYFAFTGFLLGALGGVVIYNKYVKMCPNVIGGCINLTDPLNVDVTEETIGQEEKINELENCLASPIQSETINVLLLGEAGAGKTNIVKGLAKRIREGKAPTILKGVKIFAVNTASLKEKKFSAGGKLKAILDAAKGFEDKVIFFFDELHCASKENALDGQQLAELLKTELQDRKIRCVAATTLKEYEEHIKPNAPFDQRFEKIRIHPPKSEIEPKSEIMKILRCFGEAYGQGLEIQQEALNAVVRISDEKFVDEAHPRKSKRLLKKCINYVTNFRPKKIAAELIKAREIYSDIKREAAEKARVNPQWIGSEAAKEMAKSLAQAQDKILHWEVLEKAQNEALDELHELRKALFGMYQQRARLAHSIVENLSNPKKEAAIEAGKKEFAFINFYLIPAVQQQLKEKMTQFEKKYEPLPTHVDAKVVEQIGATIEKF